MIIAVSHWFLLGRSLQSGFSKEFYFEVSPCLWHSIISYVVLSNFDNIFVVSFIIEKSRFPGASGGFEINSNIINKTAFFLGDDINLADYLDEVFCLVTKIKELFFLILIPRHNFPKFGWWNICMRSPRHRRRPPQLQRNLSGEK